MKVDYCRLNEVLTSIAAAGPDVISFLEQTLLVPAFVSIPYLIIE